MKTTAVIMAGGKGERFWPKSRSSFPKQFLSLTTDGKTMLQHTVERLLPVVDLGDVYIVTNQDYVEIVKEQMPELPPENILAEPMARNTAPCIGLAAAVIQSKYEDAVMLVLPSDHLIKYTEMYVDTLRQAIDLAQEGENLVTLGITPTYPETGYGYINFVRDEANKQRGIYKVNRFGKSRISTPRKNTSVRGSTSGTAVCSSGSSPRFWKSLGSSCPIPMRAWSESGMRSDRKILIWS